jgi:hypothetical protein
MRIEKFLIEPRPAKRYLSLGKKPSEGLERAKNCSNDSEYFAVIAIDWRKVIVGRK